MKEYTPFTVRTEKGWFNSNHFIDYTCPVYDYTSPAYEGTVQFMQVGGKRDYAEYLAKRLNTVYSTGINHGILSKAGTIVLV